MIFAGMASPPKGAETGEQREGRKYNQNPLHYKRHAKTHQFTGREATML